MTNKSAQENNVLYGVGFIRNRSLLVAVLLENKGSKEFTLYGKKYSVKGYYRKNGGTVTSVEQATTFSPGISIATLSEILGNDGIELLKITRHDIPNVLNQKYNPTAL